MVEGLRCGRLRSKHPSHLQPGMSQEPVTPADNSTAEEATSRSSAWVIAVVAVFVGEAAALLLLVTVSIVTCHRQVAADA